MRNSLDSFGATRSGCSPSSRRILSLERAPHDLSRDPAVARTFFLLMLEELLGACGVQTKPADPPFEALMEQSLIERRIQRGADEREGPR